MTGLQSPVMAHGSMLSEGRLWLEEVLAIASGDKPTAAPAGALAGAGGIAWWRGDVPAARAAYEEALAIERELGDSARIAEALYNLAFPVAGRDNVQAVRGLLEESLELFRAVGNESGAARALEIGQATRRVRKRDHAALYSLIRPPKTGVLFTWAAGTDRKGIVARSGALRPSPR